MAVSALAIGVHRLMAAENTAAAVTVGEQVNIYPVHMPPKAAPAIVVNRLFQTKGEEGGDLIGLAVTVFAKTVNEIESIGETLIDELDGTSDFSFGGLIGITFIKASSDVTGF
jgi:hypothetical protein